MPIEGLSDVVRIPRLGKIHLGVKAISGKGAEYPKATDHFVVPEEVAAVYGPRPTEIEIMFPVEDPEIFAQQWLRAYSLSQGLVCIGDGLEAHRKVDVETGALADHKTNQWEWKDITCDAQECPEYQTKRCRRVMNLQFLLPRVPGLGVYQIDTSSFYSIVSINSMIKMLKGMLGRCAMVPLTLALGPIEVSPLGLTKKTVYTMHIKKDIKLAELAQIAQLPPGKVLIPEPETEKPPEDLFPEGIIADQPSEEPPQGTNGDGHGELPADQEFDRLFGNELVKAPIDKSWFNESLKPLTLEGWDVAAYVHNTFPEAKGVKLWDAVESLSREHQEAFVREVQKRLEAKKC